MDFQKKENTLKVISTKAPEPDRNHLEYYKYSLNYLRLIIKSFQINKVVKIFYAIDSLIMQWLRV